MIGSLVLTGLQDCQDLQDFVIEETIQLILGRIRFSILARIACGA